MELDASIPPSSTGDKNSFAYISARDRWPVILTGAINDVHRAVMDTDDREKIKEGKCIIEEIDTLKYELQHNRQLTPIKDDGEPDIAAYNKELADRGNPSWFEVPWLYSECYLYRRLATFFSLSQHWKGYDVFAKQKISTFKSSRPAVIELATRYKQISEELKQSRKLKGMPDGHDAAEEILFAEMCEICLWGNATDLSLLTNLTYEDIQKLQGSAARKAAEQNILVNALPAAYEVLATERKLKLGNSAESERRVDIILDNAGFELYVDLILAGFLLNANLATTVVLHPKNIPWFVSDVLPGDFTALLNALADPQTFYTSQEDKYSPPHPEPQRLSDVEVEELKFLFDEWSTYHANGQLVIRPNAFWTTADSFWRLPNMAPSLYADLQTSALVVFKGDLNYRKLVCDAWWDPTTPFEEAIGPLGKSHSGIRTLALRTCKADTVVGLPKGKDEELRENPDQRDWAWSGKWAVVQFWDGKKTVESDVN